VAAKRKQALHATLNSSKLGFTINKVTALKVNLCRLQRTPRVAQCPAVGKHARLGVGE
jgi:hypothetical protein